MDIFEVSVENAFCQDDDVILLKLSSTTIELNIYFKKNDANRLVVFCENREEFCIAGESANSNVHWVKEVDNNYCILIGEDQDNWEIGLSVQEIVMHNIAHEIRNIL